MRLWKTNPSVAGPAAPLVLEGLRGAGRVDLVPLTPEARDALDGADRVTIPHFPFRIGRRHRARGADGEAPPVANDLNLADTGRLLRVSRAHLVVHRDPGGRLEVEDCGSTCGTTVAGTFLHRDRPRLRCVVRDGDCIAFGEDDSPYAFRLVVDSPD